MDNWLFFLIIGIGIVSSFLNKKTKTISQGPISKPKETEAPSTSYYPDRKDEPRWNEQPKRSETVRWNEQPKRTETKKTAPVHHFEGAMESKVERVKKKDAYTDGSDREGLTAFKLEHNQVAQGVIWSEILGPPRSRRPHSLRQR